MSNAPRTKIDSYNLYHRGCFGNRLRAWAGWDAFAASYLFGEWPKDKPIALRLKNKPGTTPVNYCVPLLYNEAYATVQQWMNLGVIATSEELEINEIGPDKHIVLQGEVTRKFEWSLRYSEHQAIMRNAWVHHETAVEGLACLMKLRSVMDATSFDQLMDLFDIYDDVHSELIVEFSVYAIPVGLFQTNTVFWEVRGY